MLVRLFGFRGMEETPIPIPRHFTAESVFLLLHPYEWALNSTSNGTTPVQIGPSPLINDHTKLVRVEVPDGFAIRYEVLTPQYIAQGVRQATVNSPILTGIQHINFYAGWALSFIDAAGT